MGCSRWPGCGCDITNYGNGCDAEFERSQLSRPIPIEPRPVKKPCGICHGRNYVSKIVDRNGDGTVTYGPVICECQIIDQQQGPLPEGETLPPLQAIMREPTQPRQEIPDANDPSVAVEIDPNGGIMGRLNKISKEIDGEPFLKAEPLADCVFCFGTGSVCSVDCSCLESDAQLRARILKRLETDISRRLDVTVLALYGMKREDGETDKELRDRCRDEWDKLEVFGPPKEWDGESLIEMDDAKEVVKEVVRELLADQLIEPHTIEAVIEGRTINMTIKMRLPLSEGVIVPDVQVCICCGDSGADDSAMGVLCEECHFKKRCD